MPYNCFFKRSCCLLTLLVFWAVPQVMHAQLLGTAQTKDAETPPKEIEADSLGRRTPRGTFEGFFKAMSEQNYARAGQFLTLKKSQRRASQTQRIVTTFQRLLDQSGNLVPTAFISNKPTGRTDDDDLEANVDVIGTVTANGQVITLYVENNQPADKPPLWLFSAETVDDIAAVTVGEDLLVDRILPASLKERRLGGVPVGHWLAVVVLVLLAYIIAWVIIAIISFIISRLWKKDNREKTDAIIGALQLPLRLYLAMWLFVAFSQQVGISIIVRQRFSYITVTVGIVAFLILLWRLTDFISTYSQKRMTLRKRISAISVILFLRRMAKAAIVVIGIIAILGAVGFDVTTWVAALGIGGIALALGAQKTMENFVGSVTLIADQPVRVGDFCKVGDITGTVESIGMRSTRLRTGERTVVTIPNGQFSSANIENYAHRDRFLFAPIFEFRMETTPDQLRFLLVEIRTLLYSHASVNPDPAKVRFTGLTANGYKIEVWAYVEALNFDVSQEIEEDLLLRILDIVAASGTDFAYPSQTLYMARDNGTDVEKTAQAANKIKDWVTNNELQLPQFDPEHIEKLKGTIKYPPEGSVVGKKKEEDFE